MKKNAAKRDVTYSQVPYVLQLIAVDTSSESSGRVLLAVKQATAVLLLTVNVNGHAKNQE